MDGSSSQHARGIGVVLQSPEGDKLTYKVRLQYQTTNNEIEYEALLKGLELAKFIEAKSILILGRVKPRKSEWRNILKKNCS